eukprot:scaffold5220_cov147-Isochrysis_galbana.AAC.4
MLLHCGVVQRPRYACRTCGAGVVVVGRCSGEVGCKCVSSSLSPRRARSCSCSCCLLALLARKQRRSLIF